MSSSVKVKPQTFSTGLYGSATTNKSGTKYNPSDFENKLIGLTNENIPQYLEQMVNPTYDSQIFQAQTAQRNRLANQSFENNVINPLASRGLTRGSSINQISNQFANKLADLEVDAMANEDTRNANILNNLFNYYQIPYEMMMGVSKFSHEQYKQALENALKEQQMASADGATLGSLLGTGAGYYFGGATGAEAGSTIGSQIGSLLAK